MAFMYTYTYRSSSTDGKLEMSLEDFKKWLKKFDADNDGRISKDELRGAIKASGGWFSHWKGKKGVKIADANHDGFVDDAEMSRLVEFANKHLGVHVVAY